MYKRIKSKPKKLQKYAKNIIPGLSHYLEKDQTYIYLEENGQLIIRKQKVLRYGV